MSVQPIPSPDRPDEPVAANRAARRRKGKTTDPALLQHGLADQAGRARTTARGRRINPVRRTG
jgi:hypothetical protein